MVKCGKRKKDKNKSNGKAVSFYYVCQSNAQHSMYSDAVPHILACDNSKMEHLSCIACS
jgi:hypothetical protein